MNPNPRHPLEDAALVLRRFPFGESSLMVHLMTPRHGRVVALAKGAFRPKSGYCGVLDLFDELRVSWRPSRGSGVALLVGAEVQSVRRGVSRSLDRYGVACACLEIAGLGSRESQSDPALFHLLTSALEVLHTGDVEGRLVGIAFDLGFLSCMGLEPAMEHCCTCGRDLSGERRRLVPFSYAGGGRLCESCRRSPDALAQGIEELPRPVLRVARGLLETSFDRLARIHLDGRLAADLEHFVRGFLEYHLETRPRAHAALPLDKGPPKSEPRP